MNLNRPFYSKCSANSIFNFATKFIWGAIKFSLQGELVGLNVSKISYLASTYPDGPSILFIWKTYSHPSKTGQTDSHRLHPFSRCPDGGCGRGSREKKRPQIVPLPILGTLQGRQSVQFEIGKDQRSQLEDCRSCESRRLQETGKVGLPFRFVGTLEEARRRRRRQGGQQQQPGGKRLGVLHLFRKPVLRGRRVLCFFVRKKTQRGVLLGRQH